MTAAAATGAPQLPPLMMAARCRPPISKTTADFNPLPTVVAVGNMCVWQGYALVSHDPFLTASSGIA